MKLRFSKNSIRFRLLQSEVNRLVSSGYVTETIYFGPGEQSFLTYSLIMEQKVGSVSLRHSSHEIAIVLPESIAKSWAFGEHVGVYASANIGERGGVDLIVEKDFACLDLSDADNCDTFPNPQLEASC